MSETPETDDWIEPDGLRFVDAESLDAVIRQRDEAVRQLAENEGYPGIAHDFETCRGQRDEAVKLRDEEIAEFNAGCDAYKNGVRFADLEVGPHDQTGIGYAWAAFDTLTRQRDEAVALLREATEFTPGVIRNSADSRVTQRHVWYQNARQFLATLDRTE
jgi:hypothetical protein